MWASYYITFLQILYLIQGAATFYCGTESVTKEDKRDDIIVITVCVVMFVLAEICKRN